MALGPISEQALNKALEEKYLVYIKKRSPCYSSSMFCSQVA